MKKTKLIGGLVGGVIASLAFASDDSSMEEVFSQLQEQGKTAEEIILELVNTGANLEAATAYSVGNASSIGLAISYAQAGVCLSPDEKVAQVVAEQAIQSSSEQAKNAVQARVVSTLNSFSTGGCELLADERNNGSEAFAASAGTAGTGSTAGGGAGDPPADPATPPDDVSPSQ